eukprot:scaffold53486_cov15-Tisochrysis_lutea.AAC.1
MQSTSIHSSSRCCHPEGIGQSLLETRTQIWVWGFHHWEAQVWRTGRLDRTIIRVDLFLPCASKHPGQKHQHLTHGDVDGLFLSRRPSKPSQMHEQSCISLMAMSIVSFGSFPFFFR